MLITHLNSGGMRKASKAMSEENKSMKSLSNEHRLEIYEIEDNLTENFTNNNWFAYCRVKETLGFWMGVAEGQQYCIEALKRKLGDD